MIIDIILLGAAMTLPGIAIPLAVLWAGRGKLTPDEREHREFVTAMRKALRSVPTDHCYALLVAGRVWRNIPHQGKETLPPTEWLIEAGVIEG